MRLKSIELTGFRGFGGTYRFDLNADAVIVVGANGQGKTSLFDGVLWAITGQIPRLGNEASMISMYSESGSARVAMDLDSHTGSECNIVRSFDGKQHLVRFEEDGEVLRGDVARARIVELLWPDALATSDAVAALTSAMTRSVYLQQDLVRQFIAADTEQERFRAVGELVGAGRVTELQLQLENAKTAWSRATNMRDAESRELNERIARLEARVQSLGGTESETAQGVGAAWTSWWTQARALGMSAPNPPSLTSIEAASSLEVLIKQLQSHRRAAQRKLELSRELQQLLNERPQDEAPDVDKQRILLTQAQEEEEKARAALLAAEARASEQRRRQVELRDQREELRALAQLALRHLTETCPVCGQHYDSTVVRERLESLSALPGSAEDDEDDLDVSPLARALEAAELRTQQAESTLRVYEESARRHRIWSTDVSNRLLELDLDASAPQDTANALASLVQALSETERALAAHEREGERLSLAVAQASEHARREELEQELAQARSQGSQLEAWRESRHQTNELAGRILDALREASSAVVEAQVERLEPLVQRIYATVDPHPSLRTVRLLTRFAHRRGRITTALDDPTAALSTESPSVVLSSSQMNGVAVAIYLAFNLGLPSIPLDVAMLDDPLQSLDDVNLLGLIDLLRRTKARRQLLVSTHDPRFGALLSRKLRPIGADSRTRIIELDGWRPEGPSYTERELASEDVRLRLAV